MWDVTVVNMTELDALARWVNLKPAFTLEMASGGGCWCD